MRNDDEIDTALVEANDLLRSTAQVLKRAVIDERVQGIVANWDTLHDRVLRHLRRRHKVTNEARYRVNSKIYGEPE